MSETVNVGGIALIEFVKTDCFFGHADSIRNRGQSYTLLLPAVAGPIAFALRRGKLCRKQTFFSQFKVAHTDTIQIPAKSYSRCAGKS